jgi:SAM-dependent methyltransferase
MQARQSWSPELVGGEPRTYPFVNEHTRQLQRLRALEELLDSGTVRHLEQLGVASGWQCLEVGAGGGSIALWLSERVGPTGHVTASDLDTRYLEGVLSSRANVRVLRHDVLNDELPSASFDLVHSRLLLAWLTEPRRALARLMAALKPGGWLLIEEMDFVSVQASGNLDRASSDLVNRVVAAHNAVLEGSHAFDPGFGRRAHLELELVGLEDVRSEGRVGTWRGGTAGGRVWQLTLEQLREPLQTSGLITAAELDRTIELCDDPRFVFLSQITMAAWGRHPLPGR